MKQPVYRGLLPSLVGALNNEERNIISNLYASRVDPYTIEGVISDFLQDIKEYE